jgi:S-adenosylmethionine decarboxylase proenzyme
VHYLIEFFGCDKKQLDSIVFWKRLLLGATADADVTLLNRHFYRFSPQGITGYLLLSASHISIHTWPEYKYAACDVFTCSGDDGGNGIVKYIQENLKYEKAKTRKLKRGFRISAKSL